MAGSRRPVELRPAHLGDLPEPCRTCLYWEDAEATRGGADVPRGARQAKEAWWQATQLEWGTPWRAVYDEGALVAFSLATPASHAPRARRLGAVAADDTVLLATLWVHPDHRGRGLGKLLVQSALSSAVKQRARVVQAVGSRGTWAGSTCVIPEGFLLAQGFSVEREHPRHPLLRVDLRHTVRDSVEQALVQVRRAFRVVEGVPRTAAETR